jgi:acyl-CoA hydrolase
MLKETRTTRLVKSQDLNHHGTLFAGRIAEWFTETCFLSAVRYFGKAEDLVCVKIHGLTFSKPAKSGDTIELIAVPARTGTKSLTIGAQVFVNDDVVSAVRGFATFVAVDKEGKSYAHGLSLPAEWKAAHRDLCDEAENLQAR